MDPQVRVAITAAIGYRVVESTTDSYRSVVKNRDEMPQSALASAAIVKLSMPRARPSSAHPSPRMLAAAVAFCSRNRNFGGNNLGGALSAGRAVCSARWLLACAALARGCCLVELCIVALPVALRGFSGGGVAGPWRLRRCCG